MTALDLARSHKILCHLPGIKIQKELAKGPDWHAHMQIHQGCKQDDPCYAQKMIFFHEQIQAYPKFITISLPIGLKY